VPRLLRRLFLFLGIALLAGIGLAVGAFFAARWYFTPELPDVSTIRDLQLQVPLRVYTRDDRLIGEFGAERRAPLRYDEFPQRVIDAFLAAEDDRFFEHPGIDWQGTLRAGLALALTGQKSQGGSTITMQLARNVFLSPERSYTRKFKEMLLALQMEKELSKQEILELYLNKIFLGQRAYGVGAAAQVYFNRPASELSLSQAAILAGLPKAPSRDNPVASPERARDRRDYVLRRMRDLNRISELEYQAALAEPVEVHAAVPAVDVDARYVAEMVRAELYAQLGENAYTDGLVVHTTLDSRQQEALNGALRGAVMAYEERHGWDGPEARLPDQLLLQGVPRKDLPAQGLDGYFDSLPLAAGLEPAAVLSFSTESLHLIGRGQTLYELAPEDFKWAGLSSKKTLAPGDVVRVRRDGERFRLAQLPKVQAAMVALDPGNGAILALAGGFDFLQNKYNRAVQGMRQAGSGFKPFLYASAFDFGFSPASVLLDAPVVHEEAGMGGAWRPENYGGDFKGPMRLREALVQSRNLVSVRLLQAVGVEQARDSIARFGFPRERIPDNLSMALGSGSYSPLEMARAYAVLANGGFLVTPYVIQDVRGPRGLVSEAKPLRACPECAEQIVAGNAQIAAEADPAAPPQPTNTVSADGLAPRVVSPQTVWLVDDILRDVTVRGTAARARELGRNDIAGKTGTSNDETDAWFYGFTPGLVAVSWVGYDQPEPLGKGEVGGRAALPMWMDFMRVALKDVPEQPRPRPAGLVSVRIDPVSGRLAPAGDPNAIFESVQADRVQSLEGPAPNSDTRSSVQDLF
jgi:penicillin-binding protein 1A